MTRLFVAWARHGAYHQPAGVPSAHLPHPLDDRGQAQARQLGAAVERVCAEVDCTLDPCIDASSLLRAFQTATIAADSVRERTGLAARVETFDALAERGLGSMANLSVEEIEHAMALDPRYGAPPPGWKSASDYRLPAIGAESLLDAGRRVAAHVDARMSELAGRQGQGQAVCKLFVGHGAAFRHAAVALHALALADVPALSMHHATPILFEWQPGTMRQAAGEWKRRGVADARD